MSLIECGSVCYWWDYVVMYMCLDWLSKVYVVDESMWSLKWEMDCDIWFALIHEGNCARMIGRNLCKYDGWELNWDDDYMIVLCIVKGW